MGTILNKLEILFPNLFKNEEPEEPVLSLPTHRSKTDIIVAGETGIKTHLGQCCHPIPGDKIVGLINSNHGITIHRTDCENIMSVSNPDHLVDAQWEKDLGKTKYSADLFIETFNKKGSMVDILKPFYDLNLSIISTNSRTVNNSDLYNISFEINNARILSQLISRLKKVPEVIKVNRN